ncbi:MAG: oxidoreductase [Rhodocyclales bacterium]|nr:oxidoreductase [Rhodocyclales bacterium]
MKIGIIGAGGIGQAFAGHVARAGYELVLSNNRDPDSLAEIARALGPRTSVATREQAAQADVVMLAVPWLQVEAALSGLPPWKGRILIDATNPVVGPGFQAAELGGSTSSEVVASLAPGARVVKAANTLPRTLLASDPHEAGGRRVLFVSGDDADARKDVSGILQRSGFATIDLGDLASGGKLQQFPGGPLPTLNLIKLG